MFGKGFSQSSFSGAAIACGPSVHLVSFNVRQHVCLVGFGTLKTAGWISKTTAYARWDICRKRTAGKQPHDLWSLSRLTQPLGSQKALLHVDRGLRAAFLALKCHLIRVRRRFHAGLKKNKDSFTKRERERKHLPCCLKRKHSWNASRGGTYLTYSVSHRQNKL